MDLSRHSVIIPMGKQPIKKSHMFCVCKYFNVLQFQVEFLNHQQLCNHYIIGLDFSQFYCLKNKKKVI